LTRRAQRGSAPVDFVLVAGFLLTPLFLAVVQLALALHVRNTLVACAGEGARYAAAVDRSLADGIERTKACITTSLRASYAGHVSARIVGHGAARTIDVVVRAPLPVVAYAGPARALVIHGHALREMR
jgi:Flp pilus assembly protein TadG